MQTPKSVADCPEHPVLFCTVIFPVVAPAGTVTTICVFDHEVYAVTFTPLNCTKPAPWEASNPEPFMSTVVVPAMPSVGLKPVIETTGEQVVS